MIVSEFYDLDVGTLKWVIMQPKRLLSAPDDRGGFYLKEVA